MRRTKDGKRRRGGAAPARSPKAGSPPEVSVAPPRVARRARSAHGAVSKGTTLFETDHGPRAAWPASKSSWKKG